MKLPDMEVGKRYRLLPHPGNKTELYNATVERLEEVEGFIAVDDRPLVRVIQAHRRAGHCYGAVIGRGDIIRLRPDDKVEEVE